MRYAIIDQSNTVLNVVIWDGATSYNPGDGLRLVRVEDGVLVDAGWTWDGVGQPVPPTE